MTDAPAPKNAVKLAPRADGKPLSAADFTPTTKDAEGNLVHGEAAMVGFVRLARGDYPPPAVSVDSSGPLIRRVAELEQGQLATAQALLQLTSTLARVQAELAMLRARVPTI